MTSPCSPLYSMHWPFFSWVATTAMFLEFAVGWMDSDCERHGPRQAAPPRVFSCAMPPKPVVASYCVTFLAPEMLHVYRQIRGLQQFQPLVLTEKWVHRERFPIDPTQINVIHRPPAPRPSAGFGTSRSSIGRSPFQAPKSTRSNASSDIARPAFSTSISDTSGFICCPCCA